MPTKIEWTDETWNPLVGCSRVSPGCTGCYAIGVVHRGMSAQHRGLTIKRPGERTDWTGEVREVPHLLDKPLTWRRPRRVFVNSLSDMFHPDVDPEFIRRVWETMANCGRFRTGNRPGPHTFQILTKRPQRMAAIVSRLLVHEASGKVNLYDDARTAAALAETLGGRPLPNVWLGTSIESNRYAFRADHLRDTPAAIRFLSLEPLLGPVDEVSLDGIDWVIVGGESGPGARPMDPQWVRDVRDRCASAGIPFHFKQWGAWAPEVLGNAAMKVGKKAAGRTLDGRTHDEFPA